MGPLSQLVMRSFDVADTGGWLPLGAVGFGGGGRRQTEEER